MAADRPEELGIEGGGVLGGLGRAGILEQFERALDEDPVVRRRSPGRGLAQQDRAF
jgi:hypothetical protein